MTAALIAAFGAADAGTFDYSGRGLAETSPELIVLRLRRFARKFGADVVLDSNPSDGDWSPAPFSLYLSIDWFTKRVAVDPDLPATEAAAIVHELGHILATRDTPQGSDEWSFFGWEWRVACTCGIERAWLQSCRDYALGDCREVGELSTLQVQEVLSERCRAARRKGLLDRNGAPRALR